MSKNKIIFIIKIISICSFFILVFSFAAFGISDTDVAQYLANGKYIVEHQAVPVINLFAYPNANFAMVADEWLFHTIVYLIYWLSGFAGLAIFQIAMVAAIFWLLYLAGKEKARLTALLSVLLLVILVAHERFMLRADLMSMLLVAIYIFILEKYSEDTHSTSPGQKNTKLIYALPWLQLFWVNFHGFWILGLIIMAIYFLADFITKIWRKRFESVFDFKLLAIMVISALVGLINPYGLAGFKVPFERLTELKGTHSALLNFNADFYSPFSATSEAWHLSVVMYKILLIFSSAIILLRIKKISLRHSLLYLAFLFMSIKFIRNMPMFAVVIGYILPAHLDGLLSQIRIFLSAKKQQLLNFLMFGIFLASAIFLSYLLITNKFYWREGRTRRFGLTLNNFVFPVKAAQFIEENKISGPVFNDYNIGAYFNWRFYPNQLSFIDGRTNSYDIKFLENYFKIMSGLASYQETVKIYGINYFFLNHKSNDTKILIAKLYRDPDWTLVYFDELSVIFVKNTEANQEIIKKYKIDFVTGKNFDSDDVIIKNNDDLFVARNLRGEFFLNLGLFELARDEFQKALKISKNKVVYNNLGISEQRLGNIDAAFQAFLQAAKLDKNFAQSHFNLANLYVKKEQWREAAREYERALRLDSNFPDAYLNLGVIYRTYLIDLPKAKYFWQKYLEKYPNGTQRDALEAEIRQIQTNF